MPTGEGVTCAGSRLVPPHDSDGIQPESIPLCFSLVGGLRGPLGKTDHPLPLSPRSGWQTRNQHSDVKYHQLAQTCLALSTLIQLRYIESSLTEGKLEASETWLDSRLPQSLKRAIRDMGLMSIRKTMILASQSKGHHFRVPNLLIPISSKVDQQGPKSERQAIEATGPDREIKSHGHWCCNIGNHCRGGCPCRWLI